MKNSIEEQLRSLKELNDAGVIIQEEFKKMKWEVLRKSMVKDGIKSAMKPSISSGFFKQNKKLIIFILIGVSAILFIYFTRASKVVEIKQHVFFDLADSSYVSDVKIVNRERVDFKITEEGIKFIGETNNPNFGMLKKVVNTEKKKRQAINYNFKIADPRNFLSRLDVTNKQLAKFHKPIINSEPVTETNYLSEFLNYLSFN